MATPNGTQHHNGDNVRDLKAATKQKASGIYTYAQRSIDRMVPPSSRQKAYNNVSEFAQAKPILFSFLAFQAFFSLLPLCLFLSFALSTTAFTLGAALIFAIFWIGAAAMLLVPALALASLVAALAWAWAAGSFLAARWVYVHWPISVRGEIEATAGGKGLVVAKDEGGVDAAVINEQ